tara:strand:- start:1231 stop:1797 length:567 start_codon:yes stop_codon:yes gene_type:complete
MIEMRKTQEAGETPAQITLSMIDQDLKDGVNKTEMTVKYGIKPWEVDEMFKHPLLKGRRPARKRVLSFSFVDDMSEDTLKTDFNEKVAQERAASFNETLESAVEAIDPNQITLEEAIDEAIDTVTEVKNQMQETQEAINDILSPTEFETADDELEIPSFNDTMSVVEEQEWEKNGEKELDMDDSTFEL